MMMINRYLLLISFYSFGFLNAQSYIGWQPDNYSGVHSVINNPASALNNRFVADINLFSLSALVGNDFYGFKILELSKKDYDFENSPKKFPTLSNNAIVNIDVMGPSVLFQFKENHSLALITRARLITNVNNVDGIFLEKILDNKLWNKNFIAVNQKVNATTNAWSEIGLSYATLLKQKEEDCITVGISLKYLRGLYNFYVKAQNITFDYQYNGTNPDANFIGLNNYLTYGGDFKDNKLILETNNGSGVGVDVGIIYEKKPDKSENYSYKLGFSITDIGSINYNDIIEKKYHLNSIITTENQFNSLTVDEYLDRFFIQEQSQSTNAKLPTAMHLNADWNWYKKFYLNANIDLGLVDKSQLNTNSIENSIYLTPRYESKWFTGSLPIGTKQYTGFQVGAVFRIGPFFIGSSSVITNLISSSSRGGDYFFGLKVPLYKNDKEKEDKEDRKAKRRRKKRSKRDCCP